MVNPEEVQKVANNVYLTVISRFAMLFASVIALPVGGYLGVALISRIDTLVDNQQKAAIIVARFEDKFASLESAIADATADRYRAADAARDLRLRDQKDAEQDRVNQQQDKRLDDHDARLNALSTELRKF